MTALADLVAASADVAATSSRTAKIARLAEVISGLGPDEVIPAVAFLTGQPRQGRVGVGWGTVGKVDVAPAATNSLTIADLDDFFDHLQLLGGEGSNAARRSAVTEFFSRATRHETDFVRDLLMGGLRQGALAGAVTDAVAKAAGVPAADVRRAAMLHGDLPAVARIACHEGRAGLAAVRLSVLRAVQPMLAATAPSVADAVTATAPCSVEFKLDGARIQAHRLGDQVRLFTRNLNDVTDRLPSVVAVVAHLPATSVVLDGEVLGMVDLPGDVSAPGGADPTRVAVPFEATMSAFGRHEPVGPGLDVWFFDCLYVDGRDLVDAPLRDRQLELERVAGPWRIPTIAVDGDAVAEAEEFADRCVAMGHEGVMVKQLDAPYEAGRRGKAWRKVKPVLTLDLVVLAAEWGHGRRQGWLSNLHLGARAPDGSFVMVGKTFKGMTDALLAWQTEQFLARETGRSGIVVHVAPELVVEIAIDGVQRSTRYPGGVALRFARVKRYRDDKGPDGADTIDTVRGLLARGGPGPNSPPETDSS